MHHFHYQNQQLHCEQVPLQKLADQYGTPLYVYSQESILLRLKELQESFSPLDTHISYAVKANSNLSILKLLQEHQAGFDIVSAGELFRVIEAGGDPSQCTFAGVGKTADEIRYALEKKIYAFNIESAQELETIHAIAKELNTRAPIALRVNPNVDAGTHAYISTGKKENKFGIDFEQIPELYQYAAEKLPHLHLRGLQMHIGSQLTSVDPFQQAVKKVAPLAQMLKEKYAIEFFSIGGGIGIIYEDALASGTPEWWKEQAEEERPLTVQTYAQTLLPLLQPLGLRILLEPGRFLIGNAGVLLTKVLYEKKGAAKKFLITDTGMHHLIRPALYQGHHDIVPLIKPEPQTTETETVDVVGPICETGDFTAQNRELPPVKQNDHLAILSAGAYGFTMASHYNSHPLPAEILVHGNQHTCIRKRETYHDLIQQERV